MNASYLVLLATVALLASSTAAPAPAELAAAGSCAVAGGACEEVEIEREEEAEAELLRVQLLQQAVHNRKEVVEHSFQGRERPQTSRVREFQLSAEDLGRANELIPQRLKAGGLPMADFVPRFLRVETAAGAELRAQPQEADFPLRFRYEPRPEGPRRRETAQMRQDVAAGLWSRRRRAEAAGKPDATSYRSTQEEVDMETLATNVYDWTQPDPPCYKREEHHTLTDETWGGEDNVAVYTCQCDSCMTTPTGDGISTLATNSSVRAPSVANGTGSGGAGKKARSCVFAVSGSNDLMDWSENIDGLWNGAFCGRDKYHRGFSDEAGRLVEQAGFASLATQMRSCDRLVMVGHSLGGAVASLLAECIDCKDCKKPAALAGISVEAELYTFGAPAVYDGASPTNGHAADGSFKGRRFWNYDMKSCIHRWCSSWCCWSLGNQDPVPYVAQKVGYFHPKVEAVGLDEHGEVEVWSPGSAYAAKEPDAFQWPSIMEHMNSNYIARIKMHLGR